MEPSLHPPDSGFRLADNLNETTMARALYWSERDGTWCNFTLSFSSVNETIRYTLRYSNRTPTRTGQAPVADRFEWNASPLIPIAGNFVDDGRFHPRLRMENGEPQKMFGDVLNGRAALTPLHPGYRAGPGALAIQRSSCATDGAPRGSCGDLAQSYPATSPEFFPPRALAVHGIRLAATCDVAPPGGRSRSRPVSADFC